MRLKKNIMLFLVMICVMFIPFSSTFAGAGEWDDMGWESTKYWSPYYQAYQSSFNGFHSGGGYIKICPRLNAGGTFYVYEYDPNNPDDLVGYAPHKQTCQTFYIDSYVDGSNRKAEIYVVSRYRYMYFDFWD